MGDTDDGKGCACMGGYILGTYPLLDFVENPKLLEKTKSIKNERKVNDIHPDPGNLHLKINQPNKKT